jgi:hypothetical protein
MGGRMYLRVTFSCTAWIAFGAERAVESGLLLIAAHHSRWSGLKASRR